MDSFTCPTKRSYIFSLKITCLIQTPLNIDSRYFSVSHDTKSLNVPIYNSETSFKQTPSIKRTLKKIPKVSTYQRFHSTKIFLLSIINPALQVVLFCALLILTGYLINENLTEMASDFYFSLNFIQLLWVVFSSQQNLNWQAVNAVQWHHYSFALIHAKSKTWFSSGKPINIAWKCQHDTELLYFFQS